MPMTKSQMTWHMHERSSGSSPTKTRHLVPLMTTGLFCAIANSFRLVLCARATLKCTPLYSGDGYATNERGERGVKEYLVKRAAVAELSEAQWVVLHPEP